MRLCCQCRSVRLPALSTVLSSTSPAPTSGTHASANSISCVPTAPHARRRLRRSLVNAYGSRPPALRRRWPFTLPAPWLRVRPLRSRIAMSARVFRQIRTMSVLQTRAMSIRPATPVSSFSALRRTPTLPQRSDVPSRKSFKAGHFSKSVRKPGPVSPRSVTSTSVRSTTRFSGSRSGSRSSAFAMVCSR